MATDPDGDSVTITYLPSQSFKIADLGPIIVAVIAEDSKGAVTEKRDTIYGVYVSIIPSRDLVKDGESINYEVKIIPATISANSIEWTWGPKNTPAGNSPRVDFTPDNLEQKVSIDTPKWYAFPDLECGAKSESVYEFKTTTQIDQDAFESSAEMAVFLPEKAATTTNILKLHGSPSYEASVDKNGGVTGYHVAGKGSITRTVDTRTEYYILTTSQFMPKAQAHEEVHRNEYITGEAKDYLSDEILFGMVKSYNAKSLVKLARMYDKKFKEYSKDEQDRKQEVRDKCEIAAHNVSDPIPPRYFYQRCGWTNFPLTK